MEACYQPIELDPIGSGFTGWSCDCLRRPRHRAYPCPYHQWVIGCDRRSSDDAYPYSDFTHRNAFAFGKPAAHTNNTSD